MRILGVGIVTLDIVNVVSHYPAEDSEVRAESQHLSRGGNSANTLCVLSQFGHECYWVGTLAKDASTDFILSEFSRCHVDASFRKNLTSGNQPTSYISLNISNGSRSIVHYRDLPELDFSHFKGISLDQFQWVHFEAREIQETVAMLKLAKTHHPNIKLSVEIEKNRDNLIDILNLADLYLYSKAYAVSLGFNDPQTFLNQQHRFSPDADLVCTWGEQGAFALLKSGEFLASAAYSPEIIKDTIGAGDTFNAGVIHQQLLNNDWRDTLTFACKLAGKKCGQIGFDNLG